MKQLIISEKVQKELLTDFMITGETSGLIGGYCEDEFPVYYANEEMAWMLGYDTVEELVKAIDEKVIRTEEGKILNERNRILSALSRDYTTVLLCDLKQDTYEVVKGDIFAHDDHAEKQQPVRADNCYSKQIRYFFENILIKESAPEYLERLLPDHLMDELKETDNIEFYQMKAMPGLIRQWMR